MKFACSHCQQRFDVPEHWAGRTIQCTRCEEPTLVPSPGKDLEPPPKSHDIPAPSKLQDTPAPPPRDIAPPPPRKSPLPPSDAEPLFPTRPLGRPDPLRVLLCGVLLVGGVFEYAAFKNDESPQRTWQRFANFIGGSSVPAPVFTSTSTSAPTPPPVLAQNPAATTPAPTLPIFPASTPLPPPDSLVWLAAHRNRWPKEVTLRQSEDFPAVFDGKVIGSVSLPVGTVVTLKGIAPGEIEVVSPGGGEKKISPEETNVLEFAKLEMARPEPVPTAVPLPRVATATTTPLPPPTPTPTPTPLTTPIRSYFGNSSDSVDASDPEPPANP